ncbi:Ger(x)C family spore germination protein [Schnuerera sp. xch1]|uniref:Ger(x)C family spore germination protein n=1 Tax=Schnuerera sp. xch1 TaxID=2874283 RepID=UPI001CBF1DD8|nr:Ger(x)C family spore germination protein [Schnuerera sp. xch1]MBZ2175547.1 Ger(x)C family spore germination protein [Schnuerera sp. xch1]
MRNKVILLIACSILMAFLAGCFDARELDDLGISLVIGVDLQDNRILVTAEVVDPSVSAQENEVGSDGSVKYVQGTGGNIFEALRDITLKFDRRIYLSHNKVIIFGEDFAKKDVVLYMDELFRDREQRETVYILIAKGSKAYEVMGINSGLEELPADYVHRLIKNIEFNPKTVDTNIAEYLKYYYNLGQHPVVGVVERRQRRDIDKSEQKTGTRETELSVLGSAIFKGDSLAGYLNGNDTKSYNFIIDNIQVSPITFPSPLSYEETGKKLVQNEERLSSISIIRNRTKNDVEIRGDRLILKTEVNIRGTLREVIGDIDVSKEENLKKMEEACSKTVEEGIKLAVEKVQKEYELDIFGFGLVFHRKYPEQWEKIKENWDQIFADADFQIDVKTHIIRTGLINKPLAR